MTSAILERGLPHDLFSALPLYVFFRQAKILKVKTKNQMSGGGGYLPLLRLF
jgi:hypothetical protein